MNSAFSKVMSAAEGRYFTAIEGEQALRSSLELPHRMLVSRMMQQFEFEIVDYATHAFCDVTPSFEGKKGTRMVASSSATLPKRFAKAPARLPLRKFSLGWWGIWIQPMLPVNTWRCSSISFNRVHTASCRRIAILL